MDAAAGKPRRFVDAAVSIEVPPDRVWAAWSDPRALAGWLPDRVTGQARAGDLVTWHFDRGGNDRVFRVEEATPPASLVLHEHAPQGPPLGYKVRIDAEGAGSRVSVRGYGVPAGADPAEMAECAQAGLTLSLHRLKRYAERFFGRSRRHAFVSRQANFAYRDLAPLFLTGPGVASWLAEPPGAASGEVLVATAHDVMRAWDAVDGVVELRAFPTGQGPRVVSIRMSSWTPPGRRGLDLEPLEAALGAALDRLVPRLGAA